MTNGQAPQAQNELVADLAQPEAGFSLNWQMFDKLGGPVQVTMRAALVVDWPAVMVERARFVQAALEKGWTQPTRPPAAEAHRAAAPGRAAPPVAAAAWLLELVATKLEVTPKPEGRVELKFYSTGHKFPDLYANGSAENMAKMLASTGGWTVDEHLRKAASFDVNMRVKYTLSKKLNSKGNPFKDIVAVEPVAA